MKNITRELARFAVNSTYDALPREVQHEGVRAFVNYVGCAAGGANEPVCLKMLETISEFNGKSDCVVIGSGVKLDALNAALLNSLSSAALSFNDTHYATVIHPTSPVGAALVSMAMRRKISGRELIHAVVLGDELCCRIGNILCTPPAECAVGLSTTGLLGCIGAAIAAGKVMGFNEEQMTTAIGIAANQSAGIREAHASMSSWFTPANAGRSGLWAAFLAERGYTCPDTMIEGVKGFAVSFSSNPQMNAAIDGLGQKWELLELAYKPYPCGVVIHPIIDACLEITVKHNFDARDIERVEVTVNPLCIQLCNRPAPKIRAQAMVSFPHWTATSLMYKEAGLPQVTEAMVHDTDIAALRAKVVAHADEKTGREEARVKVLMKDGRAFEAHCRHALSTPQNPMTDKHIADKTRLQMEIVFGKDKAQRAAAECWRIADRADVRPFVESLAA
ncbi:MAG TPA: MmgE/PrpD family protein [Burkholderiales bacterium]|nr:MmgE/PrpD family protein [Burkholderiales bacterium]